MTESDRILLISTVAVSVFALGASKLAIMLAKKRSHKLVQSPTLRIPLSSMQKILYSTDPDVCCVLQCLIKAGMSAGEAAETLERAKQKI